MIDQDWLDAALRFTFPSGERLEGVAGVGGSNIVLKYVEPNGKVIAVRLTREPFYFASYLHELPNGFTPSPQYDLKRLNAKLGGLIGDIQPYLLVEEYRDLFTAMIEPFVEHRLLLDTVTGQTQDDTRAIRFLFQTPVMAYRLDELATDSDDPGVREWAVEARRSIERLGPEDPELIPSTLLDNPLLVWAGAVLDGFFTVNELPAAAEGVTSAMDAVPDGLVGPFVTQAAVMLKWLITQDGESASTDRVAALYDATGIFPWTVMREGRELAPDAPRERFLEWDT